MTIKPLYSEGGPATMNFTAREFRDALGQFPTGVCIVTAEVDGTLLGATVSSFNSVSLDPPLVLFSLARSASAFPLWQKAMHFGVAVLAESQIDLSNRFARSGADKWSGLAPLRGESGVPLLRGALATFECETFARYEGGDHEIIVGRVLSFTRINASPLLFHAGGYRRIQFDQPIATPPDIDVWLHGW
jgi:flavin reductase (DIM6/NTAB) family NADH-FMN oxidoreductase RutF